MIQDQDAAFDTGDLFAYAVETAAKAKHLEQLLEKHGYDMEMYRHRVAAEVAKNQENADA